MSDTHRTPAARLLADPASPGLRLLFHAVRSSSTVGRRSEAETRADAGGTDADVANANKAESGIGVYFEDNFSFISYGYAYSLENGAEFSTYFNPSDDDTNIQGLAFNDDGSKMYVVGNTGNAKNTAPHLHFEVWHNNIIVDPREIIKKYGDVDVSTE